MNTKCIFSLVAVANLVVGDSAFSAGSETYQVTGSVVEVTTTRIIV